MNKFLPTFKLWLLCLFVVTMTLRPNLNNGVFIAMIVVWLLEGNLRELPSLAKKPYLFHLLVFYFVLLLGSVFYSENIQDGLSELQKRIPLIVLPIILPAFFRDVNVGIVLRVFVVWLCGFSVYSLVTTVMEYGFSFTNLSYYSWALPNTSGLDANYYALYISLAVLMLVDDRDKLKIFPSAWVHLIVGLYLMLFLALLASRMAFFATCAGIVVYPFFMKSLSTRQVVIITSSIVILSAVIFVSVPFLREKTLSIFERKDPRYFETKAGLEVYKQSPVFGLGITDFEPPLMKEYEKLGFQEGIDNSYNVHNEYLHLAIIAGLPALLCFILILAECVRQALRRHSYFGMAFNILFFAGCLTEVILNRHKGIIFFAFFATLIYIFPQHEKDPAR